MLTRPYRALVSAHPRQSDPDGRADRGTAFAKDLIGDTRCGERHRLGHPILSVARIGVIRPPMCCGVHHLNACSRLERCLN